MPSPLVRRLVLSGLVTLAAGPASAQAREVQPGARIRFTGDSVGSAVTALVLERRGDTLKVIRGSAAPFEVRLSEVRTLRISEGRSRAQGAGVGALWGAGINLFSIILLVAAGADCGDCDVDVDGSDLAVSLLSGGLTGALVGVIVGKERWTAVALPERASVHGVVRDRTIGLALRLSF